MARIKFWQKFILLLLCNGFAMFALAAPQTAAHSITLTWTPAAQPANIDAFRWNIYRSTVGGGPYTLIASVPAATVTYVDSAVTAGDEYFYVVTCVGSAGVESVDSAPADATIPIGDFQGLFDRYAASTNPGGQASYILNMTSSGGLKGDVTLQVSGLPSLATASFSPAAIADGSGASTLTVTTLPATPPGEYLMTINGTNGNLTHSTKVELLVGMADFVGTISPSVQSVSASAGGSVEYSITLMDLGTKLFGHRATFSISGLPAGVTANFLPVSANPDSNESAALILSVSTSTPPGIYAPLITATGGGVAHSTNINLTVTP